MWLVTLEVRAEKRVILQIKPLVLSVLRQKWKVSQILVELPNFSHKMLNHHLGNTTIKDRWVAPTAAASNFPDCLRLYTVEMQFKSPVPVFVRIHSAVLK
jgi:hypothetical protein